MNQMEVKGKYTDYTKMPFGTHKKIPLEDVPAGYLLWYYHEKLDEWKANKIWKDSKLGLLMAYIESNLDVLNKEVK